MGGRVDSIELRHGNVHDNHVGRELLGQPDSFPAIGRFADDFDTRVGLEQEPKTFANYSMIVGNEDFCDWHDNATIRRYRQNPSIS